MDYVLTIIEKLLLAMILGGGICLASNMRPIINNALEQNKNNPIASTIERISIQSWNRYNRSSLIYTVLLFVLQLIRLVTPFQDSYIHFAGFTIMLLFWTRKLVVDKQLQERTERYRVTYVTDEIQRKGHKEVEILSIVLLLLALALFIYPISLFGNGR